EYIRSRKRILSISRYPLSYTEIMGNLAKRVRFPNKTKEVHKRRMYSSASKSGTKIRICYEAQRIQRVAKKQSGHAISNATSDRFWFVYKSENRSRIASEQNRRKNILGRRNHFCIEKMCCGNWRKIFRKTIREMAK